FAVDPGCCDTPGVGSCPASTCTPATISGRVDLLVMTPGGGVIDRECGLTFTKDPNSFSFTSARIPVSTLVAGNPSGTPCPTDRILAAGEGYTVMAVYNDVVSSATAPHRSTAIFSCTPNIDFFPIGQVGRDQRFLLAGGCDTDTFFDNGE